MYLKMRMSEHYNLHQAFSQRNLHQAIVWLRKYLHHVFLRICLTIDILLTGICNANRMENTNDPPSRWSATCRTRHILRHGTTIHGFILPLIL